MPTRRRRIWCETLPLSTLARPSTLALLERFHVEPIVAVRPDTAGADLTGLARAFDEARVSLAVWPMLDDRDGRWLNASNVDRFAAFTVDLVRRLERGGAGPREVVIDLEPSIDDVRSTFASSVQNAHFLPRAAAAAGVARASEGVAALARSLRAGGVQVSAAILPTVLLDPPGELGWQRVLGAPAAPGAPWDGVSVMLYTSILEGWSRGVVGRADARSVLAWAAGAARERFGDRAGVSVGAVGVGAFGNEPVLRSPEELADDVAIALAAGVDDLTLFDLGGVLGRSRPDAWLRAFVETPPAPALPEPTLRARLGVGAGRLFGRALSALVRKPFPGGRNPG
jgi:hypothetical protein